LTFRDRLPFTIKTWRKSQNSLSCSSSYPKVLKELRGRQGKRRSTLYFRERITLMILGQSGGKVFNDLPELPMG
jgi:hypothetical protein